MAPTKEGFPLSKVIVFCVDGCAYPFIQMMAMESAFMNLLITGTRHGALEVPVPATTSVGFPTFYTGKNLGKLGAFSTSEMDDPVFSQDFVQRAFLNGRKGIKGDALWDIADREGLQTIAFNVPVTYPAKPINGIMINSFDSIGNAWAHPLELAQEMHDFWNPTDEINTVNDADHAKFWEIRLEKEIKIASGLLTDFEWDLALITFLQIDRSCHKVMARYNDQYACRILLERMYNKVFKGLTDVLRSAHDKYGKENVEFFIMSDHGFHVTKRHLALNTFFLKEGLLAVGSPEEKRFALSYPDALSTKTIDLNKTQLWTSGQGLITINDDRFGGVVDDPVALRDDIKIILEHYTDPLNGQTIIKHVHKKEDIWSGDISYMPDLLCVPNAGYELHTPNIGGAEIRKNKPRPNSPEGAYHCYDNGFYATSFRSVGMNPAHLLELTPTILEALNVKIPKDFDMNPLPKSL